MVRLTGTAICAACLVGTLALAVGEDAWELVDESAGVRIERAEAEAGSVRYRASSLLPHPAGEVRAVLEDLEAFPLWASRLHTWQVSAQAGPEAIVYGRHDFPWPIRDRDYVVRYRWWSDQGRFLIEARAVSDANRPAEKGVIRISDMHTTWEVEARKSDVSFVRYTYRGGLGGSLPDFVLDLFRGDAMRGSFERLAARVALMRDRPNGERLSPSR